MQNARSSSFSTLEGVRLRLHCCCLQLPRPPPRFSRCVAGHGCDADDGATTTKKTGALDGCGGGGGVRRDARLKFHNISLFCLHMICVAIKFFLLLISTSIIC
jgi:hypothetical protein